MAYSRVEEPEFVETRLAKTNDNGRTWTYVSSINPSVESTFKENGKNVKGAWRYETPSLLYDRGVEAERRWKLFSQRVFSKPPNTTKKKPRSVGPRGFGIYAWQ